MLANWSGVTDLALNRWTQTNEPGRCAVRLPIFASLPQPLALLEVGTSAGLRLYPDRYIHNSVHQIDPVDGVSEVTISCTTRGSSPLPVSLPEVVWRAGMDLNPLDVSDAASMRWLEALVWPEQEYRLTRLQAAVDIARSDPPLLFGGDLVERLREVADKVPDGATLVIFHSAVLAYLDEDRRRVFEDQVRSLPAIWISNVGVGVLITDTQVMATSHDNNPTPFVLVQDCIPVALMGAHG